MKDKLIFYKIHTHLKISRYNSKVKQIIRAFVQKKINRLKMRKEYHLCTCNQCKQVIRIPKGKGKIEVTCPKYGNRFVKKS